MPGSTGSAWRQSSARAVAPGTRRCDVDPMVQVLLLGQWHSLSDRELRARHDGAHRLHAVRRLPVLLGLDAALLSEVNSQLQECDLKVVTPPVAEEGSRCLFGCKGFVRTDEDGFVEQTFAALKRLFRAARSRFMGRRAVENACFRNSLNQVAYTPPHP